MRKIVGCCTQIEAENVSVRYLEIFLTNDFETLFNDGACLAKNDICHGMLKNVLSPVGQFYSNFGLKTAESVSESESRDLLHKYFVNFTQ